MVPNTSQQVALAGARALLDKARVALKPGPEGQRFSDEDVHGLYRVGVTFLASGKLLEAKGLLAVACGLRPGQASYWRVLGYVQRELGLLDRAVMSYRHALLLEPDNADQMVELADCHLRAGERMLALGMLEPALKAYAISGATGPMPERALSLGKLLTLH